MSAAQCLCMGPGPGPAHAMSMGMASRQFSQPPCPCIKCKDRARERHQAQVKSIANNKSGICGQCVKGMLIGKQTEMGKGAGGGPGSRAKEEPCKCSGAGMGPGRGPGMGPGKGPGMGPGTCQGICPGKGPGMGIGMGPGMGHGMGPGMGPGMRPGGCQGMCQGMGPGRGPGMGPGMGPEMGTCPRKRQGAGPPMGPGQNSSMGVATNTPYSKDQGCSPSSPDSPKCQCEGAQAAAMILASASERESEEVHGIAFGGMTIQRKSTLTERGYPLSRTGCAGRLDYDDDDEAWPNDLYDEFSGRDTFGSPVLLQGHTGLLSSSGGMCRSNISCDEYCGMDTGCSPDCGKKQFANTAAVGRKQGPNPNSNLSKGVGIHICSNEYVNMILTFFMEVVGILVFFSICTITFWITLGYYIVQLLIDLKNAERNVHVAVGIVFSLLVLAFAITLVTHTNGSCVNRAMTFGKSIEPAGDTSAASYKKCTKKAAAVAKKTCAYKCKTVSKPKLKSCPAKPPLSSILSATPKCKSHCQKARKPVKLSKHYSDSQGRAIFDRSRRNSILIEMKQPPTWIIWLRDHAAEFFNRR